MSGLAQHNPQEPGPTRGAGAYQTERKITQIEIAVAERLLKGLAQRQRAGLARGGNAAVDYVRTAQALMVVRRVAQELGRPSA